MGTVAVAEDSVVVFADCVKGNSVTRVVFGVQGSFVVVFAVVMDIDCLLEMVVGSASVPDTVAVAEKLGTGLE